MTSFTGNGGGWCSQVAEEKACEAAAYGRKARREGNSIDSCASYSDGYLDEKYFRWGWAGEDEFIAEGGIEGLRAGWERKQKPATDMAKGIFDTITGKAAAE